MSGDGETAVKAFVSTEQNQPGTFERDAGKRRQTGYRGLLSAIPHGSCQKNGLRLKLKYEVRH